MVGDLLADGVPIDGVGFQLHVSETFSEKEIAGVADNLATLGAMGLEVHFTEVDVSCGSWPGYACPEWGEEQQEQQAAVYSGLLEACLGAPGVCASFETWGFTDKYSKAALPFTVNQCPHSCKPIPILHGLLTVALLHPLFCISSCTCSMANVSVRPERASASFRRELRQEAGVQRPPQHLPQWPAAWPVGAGAFRRAARGGWKKKKLPLHERLPVKC